jgi:hypothetical protein
MAAGWLAIQTGSATVEWAYVIDLTVGGNLDTYTSPQTFSDPVAAMDDLVTWCNALARPWFGGTTFDWFAESYAQTGKAALVLRSSGLDFDFAPDAQAETTLGMHPEMATFQTSLGDGCVGGWFPASGLSLTGWVRELPMGEAAGVGAVRHGVPGLARLAPLVSAWATAAELAHLPAALRAATLPRRGRVWHEAQGVWRDVAIGGYSQTRQEAHTYRVDLTARGEVL